jgi:hypothetical protein
MTGSSWSTSNQGDGNNRQGVHTRDRPEVRGRQSGFRYGGPVRGAAGTVGDPPLGSRKAGRRICSRPRVLLVVPRPRSGDDLAVRRLPQPNRTVVLGAEHDCVIPSPHDDVGAIRPGGNRDQMAGAHPLNPRRGEHRGEPCRADFAVTPDFTGVLVDFYHASSAEEVRAEEGVGLRSRHVSESHRVTAGSEKVCTPST